MRLVYQNAQRVVVHLGASNSQIDCLFDWMTALDCQLLAIPRPHTISTWENQWFWIIWHLRGQRPPDEIREALSELLQREWFSRIWVLQEAALARSAIITCGPNEVNSRVFVVMPSLLNIKCSEAEQSRLDILPGLLRANSWWGGGSNKDLSTLIQKFGRSKASDPRDIIYALLGLSGDANSSDLLRPNYQISLEQAIQQSVAYFLIQTHGLPAHTGTRVQTLPKWSINQFLDSLPDLAFEVFRWAVHHSQDELLYNLFVSQRERQDDELLQRYMTYSAYEPSIMPTYNGRLNNMRLPEILEPQQIGYFNNCGPPITIAIKNENSALVELLLKFQDVDVETQDSDGNTPLSIAVGQGDTVVANSILQRRQGDLHEADRGRSTAAWTTLDDRISSQTHTVLYAAPLSMPLLIAVRRGDMTAVEAILDQEEGSVYGVDSDGDGPLNIAARRGDDDILGLLLDKFSDRLGGLLLSLRGSDGLTPFESALVANSPAIIRRLLKYHDDAVQIAVRANQFVFLRRILDVKPSLADHRPFSWTRITNTAGALPHKGAGLYPTPLWIAASRGDLRNARLLVEKGADIESMAQLFWTEERLNLDKLRPYLVTDVGVHTRTWTKPIWIAASNGHAEVVKFLIQHGADIDTRDSDFGMTPFWRAAQQDRPEVMRVLIEGGADIRSSLVW